MHILVVHNAKSGNASLLNDIKKAFAQRGETPEFVPISDPSVKRKAKACGAKRGSVLVAAGGDGTVNYVAGLAVAANTKFGVIPAGTLNHFAKDAKIPLQVEAAVNTIVGGKTMQIDTATVNGRLFVNNSSLGFYPQSLRARAQFRHTLGNIPAALIGLGSVIAHPRRYHVELLVDGKKRMRRTPFVFVGNNSYTISTKALFERSSLTQGTLAVYVVKAEKPWHIIRMAAHALFTKKRRTPDFDIYYTDCCTIKTKHNTLHVALDGEVAAIQNPLTYKAQPKSLRLLVP